MPKGIGGRFSTIALALAILSFSAQLIIALAQAYNGVLQVSQADRVNADTRSSLAEIRATSSALLSNQSEQFSKVLQAALNTAIPAAVEDISPEGDEDDNDYGVSEGAARDLEERLFVRLNEALSAQGSSRPITIRAPDPEPSPLYGRLSTFPEDKEQGQRYLSILNSLSAQDAAIFARTATMIRDRAKDGRSPSIVILSTGEPVTPTSRLINLGLLTSSEATPSRSGVPRNRIRLTDSGIGVASIFLGVNELPSWLRELRKGPTE